ncbi:MAG TPA: hypothetical protein VKR83_05945 [Ktedonobacteraceae bacterium]|nr:hypothetical protein [Ktedonobacteraceae bacterium]
MTVTQKFQTQTELPGVIRSTPLPQPPYTPFAYVELAHPGAGAVFRAFPFASTARIMNQMQRRERLVFMLLDGRRRVIDVARLLHLTEVHVARIMVQLLKCGYVEYVYG